VRDAKRVSSAKALQTHSKVMKKAMRNRPTVGSSSRETASRGPSSPMASTAGGTQSRAPSSGPTGLIQCSHCTATDVRVIPAWSWLSRARTERPSLAFSLAQGPHGAAHARSLLPRVPRGALTRGQHVRGHEVRARRQQAGRQERLLQDVACRKESGRVREWRRMGQRLTRRPLEGSRG
jgi:hypothetical protein